MRLFRQVGGLALAFALLGVELVGASVAKLTEPAPSLAQRLRHWAEVFQAHPRNELGEYPVSQPVVDFIKAALDMVVDNLLEFTADKTCQSILKELEPGLGVPLVGSDKATTDYTQCREFRWSLSKLGNSYLKVLCDMNEIVELRLEAGSESFDALNKFLKNSIRALENGHKMHIYDFGIFPCDPKQVLSERIDFIKSAQEKVAQLTEEDVETFIGTVYADYGALVSETTILLEQMIKDLEIILKGVEEAHRVGAYEFLKERLAISFDESFFDGCVDLEELAINFRTRLWKDPTEVLALAQLQIVSKLLKFKLDFPQMNHEINLGSGMLFSYDHEFWDAFDEGPPLIGEAMVRELGDPEKGFGPLSPFEEGIESLRAWVYSLYEKLQPSSDRPVAAGQAREWLNEVEANLYLVLEGIEKSDGRQGLYNLASTFEHWASIALNIERMLVMLYGTENIERGEGEPGHFWVKLTFVIDKICVTSMAISYVEASTAQRDQRGEYGGQQGSVDFQSESDCIQRASGVARTGGCRYVVIALCLTAMAALLAHIVSGRR